MEDGYMEIEFPLGNLYMNGQIILGNCCMDDDYMELRKIITWMVKFFLENDDMEHDLHEDWHPLENHCMDGQLLVENDFMEDGYTEIRNPLGESLHE